jgi:hypothetical protein
VASSTLYSIPGGSRTPFTEPLFHQHLAQSSIGWIGSAVSLCKLAGNGLDHSSKQDGEIPIQKLKKRFFIAEQQSIKE